MLNVAVILTWGASLATASYVGCSDSSGNAVSCGFPNDSGTSSTNGIVIGSVLALFVILFGLAFKAFRGKSSRTTPQRPLAARHDNMHQPPQRAHLRQVPVTTQPTFDNPYTHHHLNSSYPPQNESSVPAFPPSTYPGGGTDPSGSPPPYSAISS
ncbi:hypothetical protein AX16_008770 [Volvariella volvacea WC 439]|nr:hypothetical protein AX16_008770 [Volvariella volvacea WC 439]